MGQDSSKLTGAKITYTTPEDEFTVNSDDCVQGPDPRTETEKNLELRRRLHEAEALLSRGVACLNRVGWETGETDDEWKLAARKWLEQQKLDRKLSALLK
jgi:hypothetical protein